MIFDREYYDKSLWMMLKADKENRNKIVEFIKDMPCELVLKIRWCIETYEEYRSNNANVYDFFGYYMANDNTKYCYSIDQCGYLIIDKRWSNDENEEMVMTIALAINDSLSQALEIGYLFFDNEKIDYAYISYSDSVLKEYVSTGQYELNYIESHFMPKEIFLKDMNDKKSVRRLLRGNKRRFWEK